MVCTTFCIFFFFNDTATTEIYTLSLHDALPIYNRSRFPNCWWLNQCSSLRSSRGLTLSLTTWCRFALERRRSEEHTSELQSQSNLVCRLLLEKKKNILYTVLAMATSTVLYRSCY